MTRQLRHTAGFWIGSSNTRIHVDPGPGALVRCWASRPPLDPEKLDGIVISHRHIDHCSDASVMIEAMTRFGTRREGQVILPQDALTEPVLYPHVRAFLPEPPVIMVPGLRVKIKDIGVEIGLKHQHPVETYGVIFHASDARIAYIADTAYQESLITAYRGCEVAIVNTTLYEPRAGFDHLCLGEAFELLMNLQPRVAVLTHFGGALLRARPWEKIQETSRQLGFPIIAATDGRFIDLETLLHPSG